MSILRVQVMHILTKIHQNQFSHLSHYLPDFPQGYWVMFFTKYLCVTEIVSQQPIRNTASGLSSSSQSILLSPPQSASTPLSTPDVSTDKSPKPALPPKPTIKVCIKSSILRFSLKSAKNGHFNIYVPLVERPRLLKLVSNDGGPWAASYRYMNLHKVNYMDGP